MRILVSNDDGIYSPGLAVLANEAARFGEVRIVAPDVEQSSMGQAIANTTARWFWTKIQWDASTTGLRLFPFRNQEKLKSHEPEPTMRAHW
jgi:hypothetical protein